MSSPWLSSRLSQAGTPPILRHRCAPRGPMLGVGGWLPRLACDRCPLCPNSEKLFDFSDPIAETRIDGSSLEGARRRRAAPAPAARGRSAAAPLAAPPG